MVWALYSQTRRIDGEKIAAEDFESGPKLVLQFFLPLGRQTGRGDDERPLRLAALVERLPDHPRFDGLAQANLVGQEESAPRAGDNPVCGKKLVRQNLGAGVGQLPPMLAVSNRAAIIFSSNRHGSSHSPWAARSNGESIFCISERRRIF